MKGFDLKKMKKGLI